MKHTINSFLKINNESSLGVDTFDTFVDVVVVVVVDCRS